MPQPRLQCRGTELGRRRAVGSLAGTVRSLLPKLLEHGGVTEEEVTMDTLEERKRSGAVELHAQVDTAPQVCTWVRTLP